MTLPPPLGQRPCVDYPRGPSFVVLSEERALFSSGGLFELDLTSGEVTRSDVTHAPCAIAADGNTIAVRDVKASGEIGLSLDGGESFSWNQHQQFRCQESYLVASGDAMLVSCVTGVERWTGGSDAPVSTATRYIAPKMYASGARVVIDTPEAIRLSGDSGSSFQDRAFSDLFGSGTVVGLVGESIYATGRNADEYGLYTARWTEPFELVADAPPLSWQSNFDSWKDVLTVSDDSRIFVRRDLGSGFREIEVVASGGTAPVHPIGETHYAHGNLYVLSDMPTRAGEARPELALYIAAVPNP